MSANEFITFILNVRKEFSCLFTCSKVKFFLLFSIFKINDSKQNFHFILIQTLQQE